MAIKASNFLSMPLSSTNKKTISNVPYSNEYVAEKNRGGLAGGVAYTAEKLGLGFLRSVEGIWDFVAGGIAELFGAHQWAERQFKNDWVNYNHADEWYNPGAGWKLAGDVAGGIGTSVPAIAVNLIPGLGNAVSAGLTFATAATSAAGSGVSDSVKQTGSLTGKEWAYGAMSGATEGVLEHVTNAIGAGAGSVIKSFTKNAAKNVTKRGVLITGAKLFGGEAFEEGMSEWLNPYYAQATYDPNAKLATPSEIIYSSFVGGLSGLATGGAGGLVNNAVAKKTGAKIVDSGNTDNYIKFADGILSEDEANPSGSETMSTLRDVRDKLKDSMTKTGGKVTTERQKRLLGELSDMSLRASMNDALVSEAAYIVQNADAIAQTLSQYGYTDAEGNDVRYTADALREGLFDKNGNVKRGALQKALETNISLRTLAAQSAAGKLLMDTESFADSALSGYKVASESEFETFIENASDITKNAIAHELGLGSLEGVSMEEFNDRLSYYMANGGGETRYLSRSKKKKLFEESRGAKATNRIPARINMTSDGVRRYEANGENIAIEKDGDTYTVYDYTNRAISKPLTKDELNAALKQYARSVAEAEKTAQSAEDAVEVSKVAQEQNKAESIENSGENAVKEKPATDTEAVVKTERQNKLTEAATMAKESVKGYDALSERNKAMVRKIIREGRANGVSDDVVLVFANVSARAKIDVVWDSTISANAYYDPHSERIVANPNKQSGDDILIHELDHALRKTVKGGKVTTKIYERAIKATSEDTYKRIIDKYGLKSRDDMTEAERAAIAADEANAYFAQNALGNKDIMKHLLSEKPSLKERILDFFKGSVKDYQKVPRLERQAARYYKQFKKWFDEFAGNRRYNTMGGVAYANNTDTRFSLPYDDAIDKLENGVLDTTQNTHLRVLEHTPQIYIDKAGASDREIVMAWDIAYLAMNKNGTLSGNYHGLGAEIMKALPAALEDPLYIVKQKNGRIAAVTKIVVKGKRAVFASIELEAYQTTIQEGETKAKKYNLVVTVTDAKPNYLQNTIFSGEIVYNKNSEDPAHFILRLKSLEKAVPTYDLAGSSNDSITENAEKSNPPDKNSSKKSSEPVKDSLGNTLTKEQADYFKDSKVRDKDGNLLAMYQGSAEEFYTFDRKKSKPSNLYGRGFYFTNSEDQARHYGKTRAFYLGVNNPVSTTERTISRAQMRKFLEAVAENEDYSIENYGTYDVAKVLSSVYDGGRSDFAMLQDVNSTAIGDLVEAIELFNDINGTAYDGIILDTEVVTFRSNQAKLISNKKPTVNPDMRMSLPLDGEEIAVEVEERNDLIAVHNLSEANLNRVLDIGGFPMPSIAVTAPELSHSNYGDISVVFGRETIDPKATSKNVVYDRDAWTPTAPRVDVKLDTKRVEGLTRELENIVSEYPEYRRDVDRFFDGNYRDNKGDYIVPEYDYRKESIGRRALEYPGLMAGYLLEQGKEIKPIYKETTYDVRNTTYTRSEAGELLEYVGITNGVTRNNITESKRQEILEKLKRYRADQIYNRIGKDLEYSKILEMVEGSVDAGYVSELLFMSEQYFRDDAGKKRYDAYATREKLQSEITDNDAFETWVFDKIQDTMERKGIKKDVEVFDSRGRRKTFAQTHDEYNVENIVKTMSKGAQEGNATFGMTAGALAANLSRQFKSVEDIRQARKYLKQVSEEDLNAFKDKTYELYDELVSRIAGSRGDLFSDGRRRDEVGEILGKCAKVRPLTVEGIKRKFDSETRGYDLGYTFDDAEAEMAMTLFETLKHVPTTYFEAKPRRVVNFSEIKMVELPDSASEALRAKLSNRRIPYEVYGKTDAERSAAINRLKDVRFSVDLYDDAEIEAKDTAPTIAPETTVGELRQALANSSRRRVYSKKQIVSLVKNFAVSDLLTQKTQGEIADAVWQSFNSASRSDIEAYSRDVAEFIMSRTMRETKVERTDADYTEALERLAALRTYIGRVTFTEADRAEIRKVADRKGEKSILGRWGYKGERRGGRVPMDVFVTDVAREVPGMAHLEEMHPADAFLEIDSIYQSAKKIASDKWEDALFGASDAELEAVTQGIADEIISAYETEGKKTEFATKMENILDRAKRSADFWKAEHDKSNKLNRYSRIAEEYARRLKDVKNKTFANSTQQQDEALSGCINKLSTITYRGVLSLKKLASAMDDISSIYSSDEFKKNVLLYKDKENSGLYSEYIKQALDYFTSKGDFRKSPKPTDKALTVEGYKALIDVMSYFEALQKNYKKVWRNDQRVDALPLAKKYVEIAKRNEKLKGGVFFKFAGSKYAKTFFDPAALVRRMDYYADGFFTEMYDDLRQGLVKAKVLEMETLEEYENFIKEHKGYIEGISSKTVKLRGFDIPITQVIDLYMASKRWQAQAGLAVSGFKYTDLKGKTVSVPGRIDEDSGYSNKDVLEEISQLQSDITALLTDNDKAYIKLVEDIYNRKARTIKMLRDYQKFGFSNVQSGYYYPITRVHKEASIDTSMKSEMDRVSNASFNKDTKRGAKQSLILQPVDNRLRRHVKGVCNYHHISPVVDSFNMLFNIDVGGNLDDPTNVSSATENTWKDGFEYFRKLMSDAQGVSSDDNLGRSILEGIRGAYATSVLGLNPKVLATQLSSLASAMSVLDLSSAKGFATSAADVEKYCKLAKLRKYENTAAYAQSVIDRDGIKKGAGGRTKSKIKKFNDALMKPITWMDSASIGRIFGMCQYEVETNQGYKVGTEKNKIEAGKLLEKTILETQQNTLSTERSAAMRSSNEFYKGATMFSADAMKMFGRVVDGFGEVEVLRSRIKSEEDANVKSDLEKKLKTARKKKTKAVAAIATSAIYMAIVARIFSWLKGKDKEEDESVVGSVAVDFFSNTIGGLPVFRDVYSYVAEGYEREDMLYSGIYSMARSYSGLGKTFWGNMSGESSYQDMLKALRDSAFATSTILGIPSKNLYNYTYGAVKRISPNAAYKWDAAFYEKNYKSDISAAIEEGDYEKATMIYEMLIGEQLGSSLSEKSVSSFSELVKSGYKVNPRDISGTLLIDGEEYALTEDEQAKVKQAHSVRVSGADKLIDKSAYKSMTEEEKAKTVNTFFDLCYNVSLYDALGYEKNNAVLLSKAVGEDVVAVFKTRTSGITSDKDKNGKTIEGSKRKKFFEALSKTGMNTNEMMLLATASGYTIKDGDIKGVSADTAKNKLLKYILSLNVSKAEKERLAEMCGFKVKNGKIVANQK